MRKAVTLTFSLPPDMVEELIKTCKELGVSRSLLIQQLLRGFLAQRKKEQK